MMKLKKSLRQLAVWIGVASLVATSAPVSVVIGQGFLSQSGSSSERVQDLTAIVNEESMTSPLMVKVLDDYQKALEVLTFQNVHTTEWNGDTIEDVKEKFATSVTPSEFTLEGTPGFTALLYSYQGELEDGVLDTVEIGFIFVEGHLVFGALNNIVSDLSGKDYMAADLAEQFKSPGTKIQDIASHEPKIKAMAHLVVDDQARDILVLDSGTDMSDGITNFYFIEDGAVAHHEELDVYGGMQGTITIMFDFMAYHYADGVVGQPPTEESDSGWSWKDESASDETTSGWSWKDDASEATSQDETAAIELIELDPLSDLMTTENVGNPQFFNVWYAYLQVLERFEFRDLGSEELTGSLISEVASDFDIGVPFIRKEQPNDALSVLIYEFKDEGDIPLEEVEIAELLLYFVDDLLVYVGISNRTSHATVERLLADVQVELFDKGAATVQDIGAANPIILGMGYMQQLDQPISVVTVPSGTSLTDANVEFYYIQDGKVQGTETLAFKEAAADLPTTMFLNLGNFFNRAAQE